MTSRAQPFNIKPVLLRVPITMVGVWRAYLLALGTYVRANYPSSRDRMINRISGLHSLLVAISTTLLRGIGAISVIFSPIFHSQRGLLAFPWLGSALGIGAAVDDPRSLPIVSAVNSHVFGVSHALEHITQ